MMTNATGIEDGKEEEFFVNLCSNISNCVSIHFQSIQSVLSFSNSLMEHEIPTSVQLKLSLNSSQLQRTFTVLRSQIEELTRLTKLYSTSWEEKNQCIKALHQQYNIKQRKFDIAVKKIEMLSGRNQALERLRIQVNWEKMFMKLNHSKSSSFGWRHVIDEYKRNTATGRTVAHLFKNLDKQKDSSNKFQVHVENINNDLDCEDNLDLDFGRETPSFGDSHLDRFSSDDEEDELRFSSQQDEDTKESSIRNWISSASQASGHVSVKNVECQHAVETKEIDIQTEPLMNTSNKETMTRDIEYKNSMIVSFEVPENIKSLSKQCFCTVAVNNHCAKKSVDEENKDTLEFVFDFKFEKDFILMSDEFQNGTLRIGFHAAEGEPMMVFAVSPLRELKVPCIREGSKIFSGDNDVTMRSAIDKKEFKFNQSCGDVSLKCHIIQTLQPFQFDKATETISLNEIVEDLLQAKIRAQMKRCKSACVETDEKPVYTEQDLEIVREDLTNKIQEVKDKYEEEINTVLLSHSAGSVRRRNYNHAATSPININRVADVHSSKNSRDNISRGSTTDNKQNMKRLKFSEQWGKDLPPKFLTRVHMFQDASQQYHKELKNKTVETEKTEIKKKLNAEKKLAIGKATGYSVYSRDVYLPAVFMPIKHKQGQPIPGRSFLTEPIRSLQLPFLINSVDAKDHGSLVDTYE